MGALRTIFAALGRRHRHAALAALLATAALFDALGVAVPDAGRDSDGRPVAQAVFNIWVQIGLLIVSALISYALRPRPPTPRPAALGEFNVPTAEEGRPIPVVFGTVWITGPNVLWYGDLNSTPIKKGGK